MPDFYTRSNGEKVDITTMHFPHLKSSADKLRREIEDGKHAGREAELAAMDSELVNRTVVYRAELNEIIRTSTDQEAVDKALADLAKLDAQP